jgi:hypothetical protein
MIWITTDNRARSLDFNRALVYIHLRPLPRLQIETCGLDYCSLWLR